MPEKLTEPRRRGITPSTGRIERCPVCGRRVGVMANGKLAEHFTYAGAIAGACEGSGSRA
jgi:hypothetical protein